MFCGSVGSSALSNTIGGRSSRLARGSFACASCDGLSQHKTFPYKPENLQEAPRQSWNHCPIFQSSCPALGALTMLPLLPQHETGGFSLTHDSRYVRVDHVHGDMQCHWSPNLETIDRLLRCTYQYQNGPACAGLQPVTLPGLARMCILTSTYCG